MAAEGHPDASGVDGRSVRRAEVREGGHVVAMRADAVGRDGSVGDQAELDVDHVVVEVSPVQEPGVAPTV